MALFRVPTDDKKDDFFVAGFTRRTRPSQVPDAGSTLVLFSLATAGLGVVRRKLSK